MAWTGRRDRRTSGWLGRGAGRWVGGGLALAGVLLVVPSLLSPTREMSVSDREHGSLLSRQWEWSWGRVRVTGLEGVELRDQWNVPGLAVLAALLAVALVGVAVWCFPRVSWGRVAGLVTVGLLAGRVLTTVAGRIGASLGEIDTGAAGLTVRTDMTSAGSLETAAAVVLVLAVALMAATASRSVGRAAAVPAPTPTPEPGADPSAWIAPGRSAGLRPAGEHLSTDPVSFGDVHGRGTADSAPGPRAARTRTNTPAELGGTGEES